MPPPRFSLKRARPQPTIGDRWYRVDVGDGPQVFVHFPATAGGDLDARRPDGLLIQGEGLSAEMLRDIPLGAITRAANTPIPGHTSLDGLIASLPRLERSAFSTVDDFAAAVATQYRAFNAAGQSPAKAIAERSEVTSRVAHSWIKLARRKGLIPPGQRS